MGRKKKEQTQTPTITSCLSCKYRVVIKKQNIDTPSCCFSRTINDKKNMTSCDMYSEYGKMGY